MCNNIEKTSEYACSGCGACCSVCPAGAVSLQLDGAGFFSAKVESEKCVHCGLCMQVCNRYESEIKGISLYDAKHYALQSSSKNIVNKCSSGGIAHEIAAYLIDQGWKVAGAVYNYETNRVEHRIISRKEELHYLDGSKYLQSNPQKAFRKVLEELKNNPNSHFVIFGTPCQLAGMDKCAVQMGIRSRMLLVEIFCHGVPTYFLWDEECKRISRKLGTQRYDSVQFRHKKNGWHTYCLKVEAGNHIFYGSREKELFWQAFFENILLGDSCYSCRLRKEISVADLRLGDYWGKRFQNRNDGVSAVFACSDEGDKIIRELTGKQVLLSFEEGTVKEMLAAQNMGGYHQKALHDKAMSILREEGNIRKALNNYRKELPVRQRIKQVLLQISGIIPDKARAGVRRYYRNICSN